MERERLLTLSAYLGSTTPEASILIEFLVIKLNHMQLQYLAIFDPKKTSSYHSTKYMRQQIPFPTSVSLS